jgi:hypothetical protein
MVVAEALDDATGFAVFDAATPAGVGRKEFDDGAARRSIMNLLASVAIAPVPPWVPAPRMTAASYVRQPLSIATRQ